jgi:hypothetical protein
MAVKKTDLKDAAPAEESGGTPIVVRRQIMTTDSVPPAATDVEPADVDTKVTTKKVKIEPLDASLATEGPAAEETTETTTAKPAASTGAEPAKSTVATANSEKTAEPKTEPKADPKPAKAEPAEETPPAETEGFDLGGDDDRSDPSQHPLDEAAAKADKEAQEKQAVLDKLVLEEKYFLPINQVEKRRAKLTALIILLLLLVAAGAAAYAVLNDLVDVPYLKK